MSDPRMTPARRDEGKRAQQRVALAIAAIVGAVLITVALWVWQSSTQDADRDRARHDTECELHLVPAAKCR